MKRLSLLTYVKERTKSSIGFTVVISLYLAFCIGAGIWLGVLGATGNCIRAFAFMLFVPVIYLAEWIVRLELTPATCALMLLIAVGSLLGGGFNLYTIVPFFDTVLHGTSGLVFACIGFSLLKAFIGNPENNKSFWACLVFGFIFAMAIASLWELFEYTAHLVTGLDIEEDTVINGFQSFLLSGDHNNPVVIEGIRETVIFLEDGTTYTIAGGYLDIGLIDTVCDMAICFGGAALYFAALVIDWYAGKQRLYKFLIPKYTGTKTLSQTEQTAEDIAA